MKILRVLCGTIADISLKVTSDQVSGGWAGRQVYKRQHVRNKKPMTEDVMVSGG
jgi:hypothetical protein